MDRRFIGILLVLLGGLLGGCRELPPRVMAPPGPRLTVMTYNVNWGYCQPEAVVAAIRRRDADIVCVQETHRRWEERLTRDLGHRYPHRRFVSGAGAGGIGILSTHPLLATRVIRTTAGWFPLLVAEVQTDLGPVRVLSCHLKPPVSARGGVSISAYFAADDVHQAELTEALATIGDDLPLIVLGDCNEDETGDGLAPLRHRGLQDALALYDDASVTWRWPLGWGMRLSGRYDHLFFSPDLRCTGAVVDRVEASDHDPVTAVFVSGDAPGCRSIPPGPGSDLPREQ